MAPLVRGDCLAVVRATRGATFGVQEQDLDIPPMETPDAEPGECPSPQVRRLDLAPLASIRSKL